jgi:hypothetical protein
MDTNHDYPALPAQHHDHAAAGRVSGRPVEEGGDLSCNDLYQIDRRPPSGWLCSSTHYDFSLTSSRNLARTDPGYSWGHLSPMAMNHAIHREQIPATSGDTWSPIAMTSRDNLVPVALK